MKIKILGAAGGEVTGSSYLVETTTAKVLIDAGMFQGGGVAEEKNNNQIIDPIGIDAILLTHAHLDHTGRVPVLLKNGYRNPIYATAATIELAEIVLQDAAKIQVQDVMRKNKQHPENHLQALYTPSDMFSFHELCKSVSLHTPIAIAQGITARFYEAGHMLGSASIELMIQENGQNKIIVFSGDLGPRDQPILRHFEQLPHADLIFLESTYGDRNHRPYSQTIAEFEQVVHQIVAEKGKILIPAFAIGRTQQILYHLAILFFQNKVTPFPVFVDSPMALAVQKVMNHHPDLFDQEALDWQRRGAFPLDPKWFKFTSSVEESKQLNKLDGPCVILAGSGMCNAGRIQYHLKFNLDKFTTHVMIVGYQGYGSLGRQLIEGAKTVKIHGEEIQVRATIHTLNGFSAHAGQSDLLLWLSSMLVDRPKIVLTHGENSEREALALQIEKKFALQPLLPQLNEIIEI